MRATSRRRTTPGAGSCGSPVGVPPAPPLIGPPLSESALRTPPPARPPARRVPPARGRTVRPWVLPMTVSAPEVPPTGPVPPEASPSELMRTDGEAGPLAEVVLDIVRPVLRPVEV